MKDTSPEMEARFVELMMSRTPGERLAMACNMFQTAKALVQAGIRHEYGDVSPGQMRRLTFLRFYGEDYSADERERIARYLEDV